MRSISNDQSIFYLSHIELVSVPLMLAFDNNFAYSLDIRVKLLLVFMACIL